MSSPKIDEREYEQIYNLPTHLICVFGADGTFLKTNIAQKYILGWEPEELIGQSVGSFIHPDDIERTVAAMGRLLRGEATTITDFENRCIHKGGGYRWISWAGNASNGSIFAIGSDVTEKRAHEARARQAHDALQKSRDQLEIILSEMTDGVLVYDRTGRYLYANEVGARMCGFSSATEFIAAAPQAVLDRFEMLDEQGRPFPIERLPGRLALNGVRNPPEAVIQFRFLNTSEVRWSIVNARPVFDEQGQVNLAISIFKDFTDRRRAELDRERLLSELRRQEEAARLLDEATQILTSSLDYQATLERVGQIAIQRLNGWVGINLLDEHGELHPLVIAHSDPSRLEVAREHRRLYPPRREDSAGEFEVLRTGRTRFIPSISDAMLRAVARDEQHFEIMRYLGLRALITVALRSGEGAFGVINFASADRPYDQHDLALAEELAKRASLAIENARLYQQARDAIHVRDEFLSIASHELRTPLTPLRMSVQRLKRMAERGHDELDHAKLARATETADRQIVRMAALVDDLLDVARISAGRLTLNREETDVAALLHEVVERYSPQVSAAQSMIVCDASTPVLLQADRLRIEQVMVNLLTNALKYAPKSRIHLAVQQENGRVVLRVADNGPGISRENQARIFERFERATAADKVSGLGLGLFITRQIVEAHGGTIRVESEPGQGAAFVVELPAS